jgi:hypothetical protein
LSIIFYEIFSSFINNLKTLRYLEFVLPGEVFFHYLAAADGVCRSSAATWPHPDKPECEAHPALEIGKRQWNLPDFFELSNDLGASVFHSTASL